MAERETYRLHMEELNTAFDMRHILTVTELSKYFGRSRKWIVSNFGAPLAGGYTSTYIANELSKRDSRVKLRKV